MKMSMTSFDKIITLTNHYEILGKKMHLQKLYIVLI